MNLKLKVVLPALAVCALTAAARAGTEPAPGVETMVAVPQTGRELKVFLPVNHDPALKWPVVFLYCPGDAADEAAWMRSLVDDRDYILAAVPLPAESVRRTTAAETTACLQRERNFLGCAGAWLVSHAAADAARMFVCGAGGTAWIAALLGESAASGIRGMIMLPPGRPSGNWPDPRAVKDKPVYIGVGENYPDILNLRRAREYYRRHGAAVCYEEYPGLASGRPNAPDALRSWLLVNGGPRGAAASAPPPPADALSRFNRLLEESLSETNALAQYARFTSLSEYPLFSRGDPELRKRMQARFAVLVKSPPAREEWTADALLNDLLFREANVRRLADLKAVLAGYRALARDYPLSAGGRLAARQLPRVSEAYEKSLAATRAANQEDPVRPKSNAIKPSFPTRSRETPPFPPARR